MSIAPITRIMPMTNAGADGADTTNTSAGSNRGTGARSTAGSTELGREAFLQLLVAQLKYQDPSKPMDASEMIGQTAQLTMVDKLEGISKALASQAVTQQLTLAGSVIGKAVTFTPKGGDPVTATVNSVKFVGGELVLSTPDWDVPMSSVESIGLAPTPTTPTTPMSPPTPMSPTTTSTPPTTTSSMETSTATDTSTSVTVEPTPDAPADTPSPGATTPDTSTVPEPPGP